MYGITKKIVFTGGGIEADSALRFTLGRKRMSVYRIVQDTHSSQRRIRTSRDDALVELHQWIDEADETRPIKAYELVGLHDSPRKISLDEGLRRVKRSTWCLATAEPGNGPSPNPSDRSGRLKTRNASSKPPQPHLEPSAPHFPCLICSPSVWVQVCSATARVQMSEASRPNNNEHGDLRGLRR